MALITCQLILYRLLELKNDTVLWFESTSAKYNNFFSKNFDVLDLYIFIWLLATLVSIVVIKIITKCIQSKILTLSRFWIVFIGHSLKHFVQHFQEGLRFFLQLLELKSKSLNSCSDDIVRWILSNVAFSGQLQRKLLQSLNNEAQRILTDSDLVLNFLNMEMSGLHPRIQSKRTHIKEEGTLVGHYMFEVNNLFLELRAKSSNWERICQVCVRHLSGEAKIELAWCPSSCPALESVDVKLSMYNFNCDLQMDHSNFSSDQIVQRPCNIESIILNVLMNSKIEIILSQLMTASEEDRMSYCSPVTKLANSISPTKQANNSKLLVRLIKIESLSLPVSAINTASSSSTQVYCSTTLDSPPQRHLTTSIINTSSPYFDETFLFTLNPSSKQLTIEVYCNSGDMQLLVGTCSRSLDELKQTPSRKFFALNDSKENSSILHQINNTITDDMNTNIVTIKTSEEKRHLSNKCSQKVTSRYQGSGVINGNMNMPDNERGLLFPHTNHKKSSGTLCAEFLFMVNEPPLAPNSKNEAILSSDVNMTDESSLQTNLSKSSVSVGRDLPNTYFQYSSVRTPQKIKSSEICASSNLSIQSRKTLTNNLTEITEDNHFAESVTYNNSQRKRWSLLTSIRRRLGESRDRMQSNENNKLRSKSAESCKGSSPTFSKSIYSQCTPLRRNRRRCFLGQSREN